MLLVSGCTRPDSNTTMNETESNVLSRQKRDLVEFVSPYVGIHLHILTVNHAVGQIICVAALVLLQGLTLYNVAFPCMCVPFFPQSTTCGGADYEDLQGLHFIESLFVLVMKCALTMVSSAYIEEEDLFKGLHYFFYKISALLYNVHVALTSSCQAMYVVMLLFD